MNYKKIYLPYIDTSSFTPYYVGSRPRMATATGVRIIKNTILVAHLLGRKLYLIDFKGDILLQINTEFETDMFDYNDNRIVCTNLFDKRVSLFNLDESGIHFVDYIPVPYEHIHGVRFHEDKIFVTPRNNVVSINSDGISSIVYTSSDQVQDIIFIDDLALVVTTKGTVGISPINIPVKATTLYLYRNEHLLDQISLDGQADALCYCKKGYITLQDMNSIAEFSIIDSKIVFHRYIPGFDFPHGIDCTKDMIAVTNYGDNSITILTE